jgi:DNA-3-methyladenine glycosylase
MNITDHPSPKIITLDDRHSKLNMWLNSEIFMSVVIDREWFERASTSVAPDLIGCTLVRQLPDGQQLRGLIVETEAYQTGDPACHAYRRQTKRNQIMFGAAGYVYVYLIYGMYHCVNVVTDRDGEASAVLIRALALEADTLKLISFPGKPSRMAAGPGKLCRVMQIDLSLYGIALAAEQPLWLQKRSTDFQTRLDSGRLNLIQTTRIGLTQGTEIPWRWYLQDCPAVSKQ